MALIMKNNFMKLCWLMMALPHLYGNCCSSGFLILDP